jgi:hypothetical protein
LFCAFHRLGAAKHATEAESRSRRSRLLIYGKRVAQLDADTARAETTDQMRVMTTSAIRADPGQFGGLLKGDYALELKLGWQRDVVVGGSGHRCLSALRRIGAHRCAELSRFNRAKKPDTE